MNYMEEITERIDFSGLEEFLNSHLRTKVSFEDLVRRISVDGISAIDAEEVCTMIFDTVFYELSVARPLFLKMLFFGVLFSVIYRMLLTKNKYISDMGFLVIYSTLMVLLMQSFFMVCDIALGAIETLITFLTALIPAYAVSMVISGNGVSGAMLYEVAFVMLYLVEWLMKVFLSPLVHIFVLVLFLNHMFEEDKLSKLAGFMEKGVNLILKTSSGAVIGLGMVQSMLTPAKDRLATNTILSGMSSIPGVGNAMGTFGDIILSCGMVIKNSIGVVGLLILSVLALIPILQIGCFQVLYHVLAIVLEPIADKRITECVYGVARGCGLYLKMVLYTMLLFFILISIVSTATSFVF